MASGLFFDEKSSLTHHQAVNIQKTEHVIISRKIVCTIELLWIIAINFAVAMCFCWGLQTLKINDVLFVLKLKIGPRDWWKTTCNSLLIKCHNLTCLGGKNDVPANCLFKVQRLGETLLRFGNSFDPKIGFARLSFRFSA